MPDESTTVRKEDIDRERSILKEAADEHPALGLLLDALPDDYDPEEEADDDAG